MNAVFVLFTLGLLTACTAIVKECKPEPGDATVFATEVRRAVNAFLKDCMHLLSCMTPLPNVDVISQHLKISCAVLNNCSALLHSESLEVVWPCWKEVASEVFARNRLLSPYQVSCFGKVGDCTNKKLTSVRSTKLLINDLLKLAGLVPPTRKGR